MSKLCSTVAAIALLAALGHTPSLAQGKQEGGGAAGPGPQSGPAGGATGSSGPGGPGAPGGAAPPGAEGPSSGSRTAQPSARPDRAGETGAGGGETGRAGPGASGQRGPERSTEKEGQGAAPGSRAQSEPSGPARPTPGSARPETKQGVETPRSGDARPGERNGKDRNAGDRAGRGEGAATGGAARGASPGSTGEADKGPDRDRGRAGTAEPKDKSSATPGGRAPGSDRANETRPERGPPASDRASQDGKGPRDQPKLDERQRVEVRQSFVQVRDLNRAPRINVRIGIGAQIPRTVRLAPLPAAIIAIAPAYRRYSYVVVENEVVIVEPTSYEVVEVIELRDAGLDPGNSDGRGRAEEAVIQLGPDDRRVIVEVIEVDPTPKLAFGPIVVGSVVPESVELRPLPVVIVRRVTRLERHRYFTAGRQIAIVAPDRPRIVAVVDVQR